MAGYITRLLPVTRYRVICSLPPGECRKVYSTSGVRHGSFSTSRVRHGTCPKPTRTLAPRPGYSVRDSARKGHSANGMSLYTRVKDASARAAPHTLSTLGVVLLLSVRQSTTHIHHRREQPLHLCSRRLSLSGIYCIESPKVAPSDSGVGIAYGHL